VTGPTIVVASELEWQALSPLHGLQHLVTGVGMPGVYRAFLKSDISGPLVSIGIAGAYRDTNLAIGDVVLVGSEVVADLGVELPEGPGFSPLWDFPFGASHTRVDLHAPEIASVPIVNGCTVSTVTGTRATGILRREMFGASIETMEGYAVADIANARGVRCIEVRAISNFASERDMQPTNIRLALEALSTFWMQHGMDILEAVDEAKA
jgi:futalosine hydrolase